MTARPASLLALLFAVLALLVAGCGDDNESTGQSGAQPAATTADADQGEEAGEQEREEGDAGESEEEREKEEQEAEAAGGKECSEAGDQDGEPKEQPPSDVTILEGVHIYESEGPFGKTERFFGAIDGDAEELPAKRDAAAEALEQSGYKVLAKDQEEGTEAEAHLEGDKHTVDIQVINLCKGKLRIRYTVS
jgi:hypothetical protein